MKDPETVMYQSSLYKPLIDKANRLTEEYVSKHKLILTGGMAIDLALRVKNDNIYEDDALPDYDIISDSNLDHANALATILCNEGIPDVNVINAVHITTVRVRVKQMTFLDATYIPTECYKRIPYLDIGHLRVVHPHYQFIDQRLSMSKLMEDTGISLNIFNRLHKDIKRNNILRSHYPIEYKKIKTITKTVRIPLDLIRVDESKIENIGPEDVNTYIYTGMACVSGFVAIAILLKKYKIVDNYLETEIPADCLISILSCDYESIRPFIKNPKTFRPLLNLKPFSIKDGEYEYVDTYGSRLGCNIVEIKKGIRICVASVDFILAELLRDRIYINLDPFTSAYIEFVSIVELKRKQESSDDIWWPSLRIYGKDNLPEHKVVVLEKLMDSEKAIELKPKNSYLKNPSCKTKTGFIQDNSHYFRIDGMEDNTITHTNYNFILDQFRSFLQKQRKNTNMQNE